MRPLVRAALFALLVAAAPASASDATGGGVPLRTLCSSPTMDYCMSVWSYDYVVEIQGPLSNGATATMHRLFTTIQVFGSGFSEIGEHTLIGFAESGGWADAMSIHASINGPGFYQTQEASGRGVFGNVNAYLAEYTPSVADIRTIQFSLGSGEICRAGPPVEGMRPCYEVPEPGSLLLLVTGALGLVAAARAHGPRTRR